MNQSITLEFIISQLGEIPYCQCDSNNGKGCGSKVNVKLDRRSYNYYKRKGYPRFILGHNSKGKNNGFLGKFHTPEAKKKNSDAHVGKLVGDLNPMKRPEIVAKFKEPKSESHKNKISKALRGIPKSDKQKDKQSKIMKKLWQNQEYKEKCITSFNSPKWLDAHSGKKNTNYGKQTPHGLKIFPHKTPLQDLLLMHRWDRKYAQYLDSINEPYLYEPKYFDIKLDNRETSYTPDFYIPNKDLYIEIKGYWRDDAKDKYNEFKKQYPNIKIELLMEKDLNNIGINLKITTEEKEIINRYKNI